MATTPRRAQGAAYHSSESNAVSELEDTELLVEALKAVEACYTFLVGYNPKTKEGPPEPSSRSYCVTKCLNVMAKCRTIPAKATP